MANEEKVTICIPARYSSTRFPGKLIAPLCGKPVIQWVYERAKQTIADEVLIALDDSRIAEAVKKFNGNYVTTSPDHPSGTDRVWEAVKDSNSEIIVNIQGDEPLLEISTINALINRLKENTNIGMGTVVSNAGRNEIGNDPNCVKAVLNKNNFALYFSRSEIPFERSNNEEFDQLYLHLGLYAFRYNTLRDFVNISPGILERCEKLEQLRALENGINIYSVITENYKSLGIDIPQDLINAEKKIKCYLGSQSDKN